MKRLAAIVAVLVVIAVVAWRLLRTPVEERLMGALPGGQALYVYADAAGLRDSALFGPRLAELLGRRPAGYQLVARQFEAAAASIGAETVYVVAASGALPEAMLRSSLSDLGADCPHPLDEQSCLVEGVAVRRLGGGLVALSNGPEPADTSGSVVSLSTRAAEAVHDENALLWMAIDPGRFSELMRDPPEGWINLSLIARALIRAHSAELTLSEAAEGQVRLRLTAVCGNTEDARELEAMLGDLNGFGVAALRKAEIADWPEGLETMHVSVEESRTEAAWLLPAEPVLRLLEYTAGEPVP